MALINCPECGKEISNKAPACIHCGFPLNKVEEKNTICEIKGQKYDLSEVLEMTKNNEISKLEINDKIKMITKMSYSDALNLRTLIKEKLEIPTIYIPKKPLTTEKVDNRPKCPHCNSTEIKKLDALDRAVSVGFFGLGSNKINKSFQCKKCKYTW